MSTHQYIKSQSLRLQTGDGQTIGILKPEEWYEEDGDDDIFAVLTRLGFIRTRGQNTWTLRGSTQMDYRLAADITAHDTSEVSYE